MILCFAFMWHIDMSCNYTIAHALSVVDSFPVDWKLTPSSSSRFCLPDFASSHWAHSLCLDYFVCVRLFSCIISAFSGQTLPAVRCRPQNPNRPTSFHTWLCSTTLCITQSMAIANNGGERMQPWRTPVVTWNHPLVSPFIRTALQQSVYRLCITFTIFFGSPYHSRIFHIAGLLMLSNALRKSTKFTIKGFWPSDTFSIICRREKKDYWRNDS